MPEDDAKNPEDEFRDMLQQFLSGQAGVDPAQLAGAAGLPNDPAALQAMMSQLQNAMQPSPDGGLNWQASEDRARQIANDGATPSSENERAQLEQAFHVAALWLADTTSISDVTSTPLLMSRAEWTRQSMPVWTQLAEPVALSISDALTRVMREQAPEEMRGMVEGASQMLRSIGGALFAMQLGQVVGQLSKEVVSGGDVGLPLLDDNTAALIPQNVANFAEGLDIPIDQVQLYLAVRELAHARLFRHARWLRLRLISSVTEFARGINIDTERLESLAESFDPSHPEELRQAMVDGSLIPPKTDEQLETLSSLETMLALIEGWVDVITAEATTRLPKAGSVAETVRRRRATGGPAESALSSLVGLELRPRRLREAAAMWQAVTDAVGADDRDQLWSHPDLVPTASDIDDPSALIARLARAARGELPERDEFDAALDDLLSGRSGTADDSSSRIDPDEPAGEGDDRPPSV
ncbi:zinc-dependent metalloprotease [Okibacterium endophyticum]